MTITNHIKRVLVTPRGIIYACISILLMLNLLIGIGIIKTVAIVFFIYMLFQFYLENFSCWKCGLGFFAAVSILALAFWTKSGNIYLLAFLFMWGDAAMHTT